MTSVDLPLPDTPVTAVNVPERHREVDVAQVVLAGALDDERLAAALAPLRRDRHGSLAAQVRAGDRARLGQERLQRPVGDDLAAVLAGPGPMSTTQSAVRIVSSSCSTTSTVLPRSRSRVSVAMSLALSRWWRPIDGSSRMYRTPIRVVPIWVASRIRCASPPDSVTLVRSSVR